MAAAHETCKALSTLGGSIMRGRQEGVPMSRMMEIALEGDAVLTKFKQAFVELAYLEPRYSSDEFKQRAIRDFEDSRYQECLEVSRQAPSNS